MDDDMRPEPKQRAGKKKVRTPGDAEEAALIRTAKGAFDSVHSLAMQARILDSERSTTLQLIAGQMKWCRSEFAKLEEEVRVAMPGYENAASTAINLGEHVARLSGLLHRLDAQNSGMRRLNQTGDDSKPDWEWPEGVAVLVPAISEPKP